MIQITSTNCTPRVYLNSNAGELIIMGKSYPENAEMFYRPIMDVLLKDPAKRFSLTMGFEYLNTSSSKFIFDILKKMKKNNQVIKFSWVFEEDDEDMEDLGNILKEEMDLPMEITKTPILTIN